MLSEEEKKAIKYFYNLRSTIDESYMLFDEEINVKCGKETIKQISLVLKLIAKLQKENERLKFFSNNLFIDDYIPKKVIKDKLQENKAKTYCKNCDNTCDSYQLCKFLEELLGDE